MNRIRVGSVFVMLVVVGCTRDAPSPPPAAPPPSVTAAARDTTLGIENRVWKVRSSPTVQAGQLYVFLSDGTLLIASNTGTPSLGKWNHDGGRMTMIEEGISYKTTILQSSADSLRLRMANPGTPVVLDLVPAAAGSLHR